MSTAALISANGEGFAALGSRFRISSRLREGVPCVRFSGQSSAGRSSWSSGRSRNLSPEGFTTPDLVDAAALLESLAVPGAAPDGAA
jgi:hypothetical protein